MISNDNTPRNGRILKGSLPAQTGKQDVWYDIEVIKLQTKSIDLVQRKAEVTLILDQHTEQRSNSNKDKKRKE